VRQEVLREAEEERRRAQALQESMKKLLTPPPPTAWNVRAVDKDVDQAIQQSTTTPTLGEMARDALTAARQSYHDLLVSVGDCIRFITCGPDGKSYSSPNPRTVSPQQLFADVQAGSLLNAIPPLGLGYYIYGSRNVEDVGVMLDMWGNTQ
jgi:hypothetical protein